MIDLIIIIAVLFIMYKLGSGVLKGIAGFGSGIFKIIMKLLK